MMTTKLQTGIEILDRKLDGGIPPGQIIALSADAASQSDVFLYEITRARPTLYVTTMRSEAAVQDALAKAGANHDEVVVWRTDGEDPVSDLATLFEHIPERGNLIIDPVLVLEQTGPRYWALLDELKTQVVARDSLALLHCLEETDGSRERNVTEYMADVVFQLTTTRQGESIENQLSVPKFRGGTPLEDIVKLTMTNRVDVDISRNLV